MAKTHAVEIRVRYGETDQMGVAYHSHFLTYFEVGRTEYLRSLGTSYRDLEAKGFYLVVVQADCRYLGPAFYDDVLEVTTWVDRVRPTRVDFRSRVRRKADGAPIAEGHVVLACVNRDRRPQALPPEVVRAIEVSDRAPA
jgi:acyl-CoA thioester hydrolase